jgi:hypothetical protein
MFRTGVVFCLMGMAVLLTTAWAGPGRAAEPPDESAIVLDVTVTRLKATTSKQFPVPEKSVVARVDKVLAAPDDKNLRALLKPGTEITLRVADTSAYHKEERARISADVLSMSDSLCLEVNAAKELTAAQAPATGQPEDRYLKKRLEAAELIVEAKVLRVRPADGNGNLREQGPHWQDVTLQVVRVLKGEAPAGEKLTVRCPAPDTRPYADFPRLEAGQERIFLLQRDRELDPERLLILDPVDVQKTSRLDAIKTLLSRLR